MIGFGAMSLTSAFVLEGRAQAKFALFNGIVMMAFFLFMFVMLTNSGYNMPGIVWLVPPFIFLGGLTFSGYLHMNAEATSQEA